MIGTLVSFCLMAVAARELSGDVDTFQVLFFRSVIGLLIVALVILSTRKLHLFKSKRVATHSLRNAFHFFGQYGWFVGIGLLPLAEVFALEFTVPFWTLLIAALFLNERFTKNKLISVILGLAGVLVVVKPGIEIISYSSWIVLGAAVCYAVAHTSTKALATTEDPLTILFFMCLIQLPLGMFLSLENWIYPKEEQWLWLTAVGITALTAHYCMTKAMLYADVSVVVVMDFLRLPAIAILGVLLYSESFEISIVAGAALMLIGNVINIYSSRKIGS